MTVIHEIQQVMYVKTPHGDSISLFIIDYGPQLNTIWVVANCADGKIRHYDSNHITLVSNHTLGINLVSLRDK
jgi:hypothetical protein